MNMGIMGTANKHTSSLNFHRISKIFFISSFFLFSLFVQSVSNGWKKRYMAQKKFTCPGNTKWIYMAYLIYIDLFHLCFLSLSFSLARFVHLQLILSMLQFELKEEQAEKEKEIHSVVWRRFPHSSVCM